MKTMIKRIRSEEEGLDLVQLLIAVVILGFLIAVAALVLIGKAQSAKENAADASVANAVTAAKVAISEGANTGATAVAGTVEALGGPGGVTQAKLTIAAGVAPNADDVVITHTGAGITASATINAADGTTSVVKMGS